MSAETDTETKLAQVAQSYDAMPYVSVGVKQSQPNRLAAIAQIFGLAAKPLAQARVLELGCANGGNLLPLALRFSQAEFVGVDISPVQIAYGKQQAEALHIKNLDLICCSVTDLPATLGQFDFIICHGIYSWVEKPVQDAIFNALKSHLTAQGIGFVSYNVLPGWRMKQPVRDAGYTLLPQGLPLLEKAQAARELMSFLAKHSDPRTSYGLALREVAGRLTQAGLDYVAHAYLEDVNAPCTLTEFVQRAGTAELSYLGDSEINEMIPIGVSPELQQEIAQRSGGDQVAMEQLMDFITGRQFRYSLLVRGDHAKHMSRELFADRLKGLHFYCRSNTSLRVEAGLTVLITDGMAAWPISDDVYAQIMGRLIAAYPASIPFDTLLAGLGDPDACAPALLALVMYGVVDPSSDAMEIANTLRGKPKAFRLAAHSVRGGGTQSTTMVHGVVQIDAAMAHFLSAMDGTKTVEQLTTDFVKLCTSGQFQLSKNDRTLSVKTEISSAAAVQAKELMSGLVHLALVETSR